MNYKDDCMTTHRNSIASVNVRRWRNDSLRIDHTDVGIWGINCTGIRQKGKKIADLCQDTDYFFV